MVPFQAAWPGNADSVTAATWSGKARNSGSLPGWASISDGNLEQGNWHHFHLVQWDRWFKCFKALSHFTIDSDVFLMMYDAVCRALQEISWIVFREHRRCLEQTCPKKQMKLTPAGVSTWKTLSLNPADVGTSQFRRQPVVVVWTTRCFLLSSLLSFLVWGGEQNKRDSSQSRKRATLESFAFHPPGSVCGVKRKESGSFLWIPLKGLPAIEGWRSLAGQSGLTRWEECWGEQGSLDSH